MLDASRDSHHLHTPSYRAFLVSRTGEVKAVKPLSGKTDDVAIGLARQLAVDQRVEVWDRRRFVMLIEPESKGRGSMAR